MFQELTHPSQNAQLQPNLNNEEAAYLEIGSTSDESIELSLHDLALISGGAAVPCYQSKYAGYQRKAG